MMKINDDKIIQKKTLTIKQKQNEEKHKNNMNRKKTTCTRFCFIYFFFSRRTTLRNMKFFDGPKVKSMLRTKLKEFLKLKSFVHYFQWKLCF